MTLLSRHPDDALALALRKATRGRELAWLQYAVCLLREGGRAVAVIAAGSGYLL